MPILCNDATKKCLCMCDCLCVCVYVCAICSTLITSPNTKPDSCVKKVLLNCKIDLFCNNFSSIISIIPPKSWLSQSYAAALKKKRYRFQSLYISRCVASQDGVTNSSQFCYMYIVSLHVLQLHLSSALHINHSVQCVRSSVVNKCCLRE